MQRAGRPAGSGSASACAAYDRQTKPLADYYRAQGVLDVVDASTSVEEVSRALTEIVKRAGRPKWSSVIRATELEKMHRAGLIVWGALDKMRAMVRPGVTTMELDEFAEAYART